MLCFENDDIKQSNTFTFSILEKVAVLEASYFLIAGTQHVVKPNERSRNLDLQISMQTKCDNVIQWLVADRWFSADTPVSSTTI
jgi:hypothetical protein